MTRTEYMATVLLSKEEATASHRAYYAQYADDSVRRLVLRSIGADALARSTDPYLNDIPLSRWDSLVSSLGGGVALKLKENGDYLTLGTGVCILKAAARQIIESTKTASGDEGHACQEP